MISNNFELNCTNPYDYINSLQEAGNEKQNLWNGAELMWNSSDFKLNCQVFIKNDFHFYRSDCKVGFNMLVNGKKEEDDPKYIDFRITNSGKNTSMIRDKKVQFVPAHQNEKSFHIFLKKKILGVDDETLEMKIKQAHQCVKLNKITEDIFAIPATGNKNALQTEGNILELSHAFLEYLNAPMQLPPSFLSNDYTIRCIEEAKNILTKDYVTPLTIKELSKKVGVNSNQLKIGFKYLFGTTIRQFVIGLRLNHARQIILKTKLSLKQICNTVGYTNQGHFSNLYKDRFGLNPLADRKCNNSR